MQGKPFWVPNYEMPDRTLLLVFFIIDMIFIIGIILLYLQSVANYNLTSVIPKLSPEDNSNATLYTGIKIGFFGAFIISIMVAGGHMLTFIFYDGGYYLVGYNAGGIIGIGLIMMIGGNILFHKYYIKVNHDLNEPSIISNMLAIIPAITLIIIISTISIPSLQNGNNTVYDIYFVFVVLSFIGILLLSIFYWQIKKFENLLVKLRMALISICYMLFSIILVSILIFLPHNGNVEHNITRTSFIDILNFSLLFLSFSTTICYYLIVAVPKWLRDLFGLDETKFREDNYDFHGINPPEKILLELQELEDEKTNPEFDLSGQYVLFLDLNRKSVSYNLIKDKMSRILNVSTTIPLHSLSESSFLQIRDVTNIFIVATEIDEDIELIIDEIYELYSWDIDMVKDNIKFNGYIFSSQNTEFGLIASIPSPWNPMNKLILALFPNKILNQMINFMERFNAFVEDPLEPFVAVLTFQRSNSGQIMDILEDPISPGFPAEDQYRMFK